MGKMLKVAKKSIYVLLNNPKFFFKRIFLELKFLISPVSKKSAMNVNGVSFPLDFQLSSKVKKMHAGNFQPIISEILKRYLKKGDTFIDAGANIGYFSFVAAGLVGKEGRVHSFEPVQEYFLKLDNFARINKDYKIKANQAAVGDKKENLEIFIKGEDYIG
ncbi:MAG: FkbM family methyltransferase, partial [Patescibacteria group bacterium]